MADIKHVLQVGKLNDNINAQSVPVFKNPFFADSTLIFADSTIRRSDEIKI